MAMLAFYLSIANFFLPRKYKKIVFYVATGMILAAYLLDFVHINLFFCNGLDIISQIHTSIINIIYRLFHFISTGVYHLVALIFIAIRVGLAYLSSEIPLIIHYKNDEEYDDSTVDSDITVEQDGRMYRIVEVNAGLCTGTLRGIAIEKKINLVASQSWKFERFETIIGRCCLFFPRYKCVLCFSKI